MSARNTFALLAAATLLACGTTSTDKHAPKKPVGPSIKGLDSVEADVHPAIVAWVKDNDARTKRVSFVVDSMVISDSADILVGSRGTDAGGCRVTYTKLNIDRIEGQVSEEEEVGAHCCLGDATCKPDGTHQLLTAWRGISGKDNATLAAMVAPGGVTIEVHFPADDGPTSEILKLSPKEVAAKGFPNISSPDPMQMFLGCDPGDKGGFKCGVAAGGIQQTWLFNANQPPLLYKIEQTDH